MSSFHAISCHFIVSAYLVSVFVALICDDMTDRSRLRAGVGAGRSGVGCR